MRPICFVGLCVLEPRRGNRIKFMQIIHVALTKFKILFDK